MPAAIPLAVAAIGAGTSIYAANRQSQAAADATRAQQRANDRAANLTRNTAIADTSNQENARRMAYETQMRRYQAASGLARELGFTVPPPPEYTPLQQPDLSAEQVLDIPNSPKKPVQPSAKPPLPTASATGLPSVSRSNGDLASQISSFFRSRGVSDTETPYWVQKWDELEARGRELNDPGYANRRLSQADIFGGQRSTSSATRSPLAAILLAQQRPQTLTPPPTDLNPPGYRPPFSLANYLG